MMEVDRDHEGHCMNVRFYWESLGGLEEKWGIIFLFYKRITSMRQ